MLKVIIEIKEKDAESSSVTLKGVVPTKTSTECEKNTATVIYNAVADVLKNLN